MFRPQCCSGPLRVLLLYPAFPPTFWSFEGVLRLVGRKALFPPLGLITVAAILPKQWSFRLVDCNVSAPSEQDWAWAEIVMFSAMYVQKQDLLARIREAKSRGKPVVVGGPYATSLPEEIRAAGADFLVLDEGEVTIPLFLAALSRGETQGIFRADHKPDIGLSPVPRFDLLDFDAYDAVSLQYSRGCPFRCEFCDIIVLYGRRPRTKTPEQMLHELEHLRELGWRRGIFLVDDNFIANRRNVKSFLEALKLWQAQQGYPYRFNTEASLDLATDPELLELMAECQFDAVFLGIETPDRESLAGAGKVQNLRDDPVAAVERIQAAGLRPMGGFIIGFDGEQPGAGGRITALAEQAAIPTVMFSMLQALPHTALWQRLEREQRLRATGAGDVNQTTLLNFIPTRPVEDIAQEYVAAFRHLYDPLVYLDRVHRCFLRLAPLRHRPPWQLPRLADLLALARIVWRQGVWRTSRTRFWKHLGSILRHNPGVIDHYLAVCAQNEHFLLYRDRVRDEIWNQLAAVQPHLLDAHAVSPTVSEADTGQARGEPLGATRRLATAWVRTLIRRNRELKTPDRSS